MSKQRYSLAADLIKDPGNGGKIAAGTRGNSLVRLVTAGAETRTVALPAFPGERLALNFQEDGGDCVVTMPTALNETGNNTVTFTAVGQIVRFEAGYIGTLASPTLCWRIVNNDGATLSTV